MQDIRAFTLKLPILQKDQALLSIQINVTDAIRKVTHDPAFRQRLEAEQGTMFPWLARHSFIDMVFFQRTFERP